MSLKLFKPKSSIISNKSPSSNPKSATKSNCQMAMYSVSKPKGYKATIEASTLLRAHKIQNKA